MLFRSYNILQAQRILKVQEWNAGCLKINFLNFQISILCLIYLFFIIIIWVSKPFKKVWLLLLFSTQTAIFCGTFWYFINRDQTWAVLLKKVNVLAGPNEQYHIVEKLMPGQIVSVVANEDQWCQVSLQHSTGWLIKDDLLII